MLKLNYLLMTLLLSPFTAFAAAPLNPVDANFTITSQIVDVVIEADGSSTETIATDMQVNNDAGRIELSLARFHYRPAHDKITVIEAYQTQDGVKQDVALSRVIEKSIASPQLGINDIREITLPFDGLKIGSKVHHVIKRTVAKPVLPGFYQSEYTYGFGMPEGNSKVNVKSRIPIDFQLRAVDSQMTNFDKNRDGWYLSVFKMGPTVYHVSAEAIKSDRVTKEELKSFPRLRIVTEASWNDLYGKFSQATEPKSREALPTEFLAVLKSIAGKTPSEKAAELRHWIAENITYSGRWTGAGSDWIPRSISEIMKTKVGDCKDFAFLFIRGLRELGIEADMTVVAVPTGNRIADEISKPFDGLNYATIKQRRQVLDPIPYPGYFNHAVVRIKYSEREVYLDPTMKFAQAEYTDFHLHGRLSWTIAPGKGLQKIKIEKPVQSIVESTIQKDIGEIKVTSSVKLEGQLAEYVQALRLQVGEEKFPGTLAAFLGFIKSEKARITKGSKSNRKAKSLVFDLDFYVKNQTELTADQTLEYRHVAAIQPVYWGRIYPTAHALDFPFEMKTTTRLAKFFAKSEQSSDCVALGPFAHYKRRVKNEGGNVVIQEEARFELDEDKMGFDDYRFTSHLSELSGCFNNAALALTSVNAADKTQVPWEVKTDLTKQVKPSPTSFRSDLLKEWRRLTTLLERDPKKADSAFDLVDIYRAMGMLHSESYIPEYLDEGLSLAEKYLATHPQNAKGWAMLGRIALLKGDRPRAVKAYMSGYGADQKNTFVFSLGGRIAEKSKDIEKAVAYFKLAELHAPTIELRETAIDNQISSLCASEKTCADSEPLIEKALKLSTPTAWDYHNYATNFGVMRKYEKGIELERKALALMDFGVARSYLATLLSSRAEELLSTTSVDSQTLTKSEQLLDEALSLSREEEKISLMFLKAMIAVEKAKLDRNESSLNRAFELVAQLKDAHVGEDQLRVLKTKLETLPPMTGAKSRAPAAVSSLDYEIHRRGKWRTSPQGEIETVYAWTNPENQKILNTAAAACMVKTLPNRTIVHVDADGKIISWAEDSENAGSSCMKRRLFGTRMAKPPQGELFFDLPNGYVPLNFVTTGRPAPPKSGQAKSQ